MASAKSTTTTITATGAPGNGAPLGPGHGPGPGGATLTGMAAVELVFHFAPTTADVLRAATACRRWRALACADSVWRAKFRREKLLEKARLFEVALPPVPGRQAAAAAAVEEDDEAREAAGVGLAFYARVFALKVAQRLGSGAARRTRISLPPLHPLAFPVAAAAAAVQGYKMRDEDQYADNPDHDGGIWTAVRVWFADPAAAKARYGPIASWDTSGITDMGMLFYGRKDFNEDISRWNVSNVVLMNCTFEGATSFNGDLSRWEVGQVESMDYLFLGATLFNGDLSCWEVGQVESMDSMFQGATSFNGDLSRWEVGQVKYMTGMFNGAISFNGDLSRWEVGQVEYMFAMFHGATSFTHQLGGAWSTSTADQSYMFSGGCPGSIA